MQGACTPMVLNARGVATKGGEGRGNYGAWPAMYYNVRKP